MMDYVVRETLTQIANDCGTDKGTIHEEKHGYTEIYRHYLEPLRLEKIRLLEIGVYKGKSLNMWREYFPYAEIFGIDSGRECEIPIIEGVKIWKGRQEDREFLKRFIGESGGQFDVIIDDGGHVSENIITSFTTLFPELLDKGIYVIEDLQCSYMGGEGNPGGNNTVNMIKELLDIVNYKYLPGSYNNFNNDLSSFKGMVDYVHMYEKIVFIKKRWMC